MPIVPPQQPDPKSMQLLQSLFGQNPPVPSAQEPTIFRHRLEAPETLGEKLTGDFSQSLETFMRLLVMLAPMAGAMATGGSNKRYQQLKQSTEERELNVRDMLGMSSPRGTPRALPSREALANLHRLMRSVRERLSSLGVNDEDIEGLFGASQRMPGTPKEPGTSLANERAARFSYADRIGLTDSMKSAVESGGDVTDNLIQDFTDRAIRALRSR